MIKKVTINNFKGLPKVDVEDITRVTLIGGRNNVGKTSLLEALFLYFDRFNPEAFFRLCAWRNIQKLSLRQDDLWAPFFSMYDMDRVIEITAVYETGQIGKLALQVNKNYIRQIRVGGSNVNMVGQTASQAKPVANKSLDLTYQFGNEPIQKAHHLIGQQGIIFEAENISVQGGGGIFGGD